MYQRDNNGNINKDSTLHVESQKVVDNAIKEYIKDSETEKKIQESADGMVSLTEADLNIMLSVTEVFELVLSMAPMNVNTKVAKTFKLKGGEDMAVGLPLMYANLIINGMKTYKDVPDVMKADVKRVLEGMEMGHLAD